MNADIKGAFIRLSRVYMAFRHEGKSLTKEQVRKALEYGMKKGYTHTGQLTNEDMEGVLKEKV